MRAGPGARRLGPGPAGEGDQRCERLGRAGQPAGGTHQLPSATHLNQVGQLAQQAVVQAAATEQGLSQRREPVGWATQTRSGHSTRLPICSADQQAGAARRTRGEAGQGAGQEGFKFAAAAGGSPAWREGQRAPPPPPSAAAICSPPSAQLTSPARPTHQPQRHAGCAGPKPSPPARAARPAIAIGTPGGPLAAASPAIPNPTADLPSRRRLP